jgi:predicted AAA+ superfamily ATPase
MRTGNNVGGNEFAQLPHSLRADVKRARSCDYVVLHNPLYERTGRVNLGHALETAVFLELERRGCETDYIRTRDGYEVDFFARHSEGGVTLIQVCTDVSDPATYEREVRALTAAAREHRGATPLLLTFATLPPRSPLPKPLRWQPAIAWLLGDELPGNPR